MALEPASSGLSAELVDPRAVLEVCLCHHVRRAGRALTRSYDHALAPSGLSFGQFIMLTAIAALQPMPSPVLREVLSIDRTSLSRALKPLLKQGFVEVSGNAGRRAGHVVLTDEGARVVQEAAPLWRQAQTGATKRLGGGRTGQLLSLLAAVPALLHE